MVIIIHKLSVGSFTFLQCLSGTELLNLSGTHDTMVELNEYTFQALLVSSFDSLITTCGLFEHWCLLSIKYQLPHLLFSDIYQEASY
jgi:hypothetical protein